MTKSHWNRKDEKGFSLVELLILLGIMAVLLVAAIPTLQGVASNRNLKSAARELMGDFAICKARAVAENREYQISINTGTNNYTISTAASGSLPAFSQTKSPALLGSGTHFYSASPATYTFQPRGTVTMGNIKLENNRTSRVTITVNITGRASLDISELK